MGAGAHRLDRHIHRSVRRYHHHVAAPAPMAQIGQNVQPVGVGQRQIQQHQRRRGMGHPFERRGRGADGGRGDAGHA